MAIGRFGGAANYSRINMKLNPEKQQPENAVIDNEPVVSVEPERLPITNSSESESQTGDIIEVEPQDVSLYEKKSEGGLAYDNIAYNHEPVGSSDYEQLFMQEAGNAEAEQGYTEAQYNKIVDGIRSLRDTRGGAPVYTSPIIIHRILGVDVQIANDIMARMKRDGVINGSSVRVK
jgi:hypothetical protein